MFLREKALLGQGAFGQVYKGVWRQAVIGRDKKPVEEEVAVKIMEDATSEEDEIKFLQEAVIMGQFDHPNIVKIMGVMITDVEVSVLFRMDKIILKHDKIIMFHVQSKILWSLWPREILEATCQH